MAQVLLVAKADPFTQNARGQTALDVAKATRCPAHGKASYTRVLGFRGLGSRVLGLRALGLRGLGFRGLGFRGLGFRVERKMETTI